MKGFSFLSRSNFIIAVTREERSALLTEQKRREENKEVSLLMVTVFDSKGKCESPLHPAELSVITNTISAMFFFP